MSLGAVLVILLVVWLIVGLPQAGGRVWGYTGYGPSLSGVILLLVVLWLVFGGGGHSLNIH